MIHDPTRGWLVDLPTYTMVAGTVLPVVPGKTTADGILRGVAPDDAALANLSVIVEIPDDTPMAGDQVDPAKMRRRYKEHPRFGRNDYDPPPLTD